METATSTEVKMSNTATITESEPTIGTRVSYEDRANPLRRGTVVKINRQAPWPLSYSVKWDDGGAVICSDLRQHGWKRLAA